ncbi:MAG: hypothetical protein SVY53_04890 [Chloroflexota bacterium]|nr:hypothetical protein [Chloroflexota bacterium]
MLQLKRCSIDLDFCYARQIVDDYMVWLNVDLWFQDVEKEFADFPSMYQPPNGLFLLARNQYDV